MREGDAVFWPDPDGDVGRVVESDPEMLCLMMLSGSHAEVPPHEVARVGDRDVVGVDESGLLFYDAEGHATSSDGSREEEGEHDLDDDERCRIESAKSRISR